MRLTSLTTDHLRVPLGKPGRVSLTDPAKALRHNPRIRPARPGE